MEPVIVLIYRKGDKTDYSNYRGVSLIPTSRKLYAIFLSHT